MYKVRATALMGKTDVEIANICIDSRQVKSGSLFIAVKGSVMDGHEFIGKAIALGASAIVCQILSSKFEPHVSYVQTNNSALAAGQIAHNFFQQPSQNLRLVGVTGTNGKTTVATLLYKLFVGLGHKCGLISTVENIINGRVTPATHTTPDPIQLNELLHTMVEQGCSHVFMEVSSHAIHQHRISGLEFTGAIFTNITHDHLDYHKSFDEYIKAKKAFFDFLPASAFALTNIDDKRGLVMIQNTPARKYTYSLKNLADFKGKILENALSGLVMVVNDHEVHFRLIGEFNAYNLLAVYGAAVCLNENEEQILQCLSNTTGAEGRFDYLISPLNKIISIVDYAHTPDALINVLSTIKKLKQGNEQLITVVGCGGDRDKTKRPVMGAVACEYSDMAIFTSDNPRSEDPLKILEDMELTLNTAAKRKYVSVPDRRQAIKTAITMAKPGDIVLIAGKGHEKYQDINGIKSHFDDKEVVLEMFQLLGK